MTIAREEAAEYARSMVRDFGSWLAVDHTNYSTRDLNREVIRLAEDLGWVVEPAVYLELVPLLDDSSPLWSENESASDETLGWFHDEAVEYLNAHACPNGCVWEHDGNAGAFGCWRITEENI